MKHFVSVAKAKRLIMCTKMTVDEMFFVSEYAVETVTNKIQRFKETAEKNIPIRASERLKYNYLFIYYL
jgi:hypothetical protein